VLQRIDNVFSRLLIIRRALLLVILPVAFVAIFAGLARIGISLPWAGSHATDHGPLLVIGVFGTIIALERAVALGKIWAYVAPCCGTLAALAILFRIEYSAPTLVIGASASSALVNAVIVRRQSASFTWLMLLGSLLFLGGNVLWALGAAISVVVPAWLGFFILTIIAERLELSRLGNTPAWAKRLLFALCVLFALGVLGTLAYRAILMQILGALVIALGCWELQFDLARRTIRLPGLPRFTACSVLLGAGWLLFTGVVLLGLGLPPAGPVYDAVLHGVFVGFVLSMVFAHAPIILPAVARTTLTFRGAFYIPLIVLHASLLSRVVGDLAGLPTLRKVGATGNAIAIGCFAVVVLWTRSSRGNQASQSAQPRGISRTTMLRSIATNTSSHAASATNMKQREISNR
jgi:hypothetical protein